MLAEPLHVARQLALDLVGSAFEGDPCLARPAGRLEHYPLGYRRHDLAGEIVIGAAAEGDVGGDRPIEIFVGDRFDALADPGLQRFAGFDLMAGNSDLHRWLSFL
jgi:hypothetical protein